MCLVWMVCWDCYKQVQTNTWRRLGSNNNNNTKQSTMASSATASAAQSKQKKRQRTESGGGDTEDGGGKVGITWVLAVDGSEHGRKAFEWTL